MRESVNNGRREKGQTAKQMSNGSFEMAPAHLSTFLAIKDNNESTQAGGSPFLHCLWRSASAEH